MLFIVSRYLLYLITWIDLEIVILSEVSQEVEKEEYHLTSLIGGL